MPAAIGRLQRVRVLEESTFATDMSGSWGTAIDVRAIGPVDLDLPPNMLKDDSLRQGPWEDRLDFLGPRGRAKVALKSYLMPSGVPLNNASTAPATPRTATGRILKKALLDGWASDKGDLAVAGSTTTLLKATVGTRFSAGRAVCVPTGNGGAYEMRPVASVATNDLTVKMATTNALANGAAILNCETFYPGTPGLATGLQFLIESAARKEIVWLRGAQLVGGFGIDTPQNQMPVLTMNVESAGWYDDAEVGTPVSGSALAQATYTDADPQPFVKSAFLWQAAGTSTLQTLDTYEIKFTPSWGFEPVLAVDGENGIRGWYPTKPEPLGTLSFKIRVDDNASYDTTLFTQWKNRTPMFALIQIGNTAGNIIGIELPNLQITSVQRISQAGQLRGWAVTCKVRRDAYATDQSTLLRSAPWRLHIS